MLRLNKFDLTDTSPEDALNIEYQTISEGDKWRLDILDEFELQHGDLVVPGMEAGQISTRLDLYFLISTLTLKVLKGNIN